MHWNSGFIFLLFHYCYFSVYNFHYISPLLSSKPSHIFLPLSKFQTLFFPIIVTKCVCVHAHIVWVFLNIILSVHTMQSTCMFSGLTLWHWKAHGFRLPWERPCVLIPAFSRCLQSFVKGWRLMGFSFLIWQDQGCHPFSACHVGEILCVYLLIFWEDLSHSKHPKLLALTIFPHHMLQYYQSLRYESGFSFNPVHCFLA